MAHLLTTRISARQILDFVQKKSPNRENPDAATLMNVAHEAASLAAPKALYREAPVDGRGQTHVIIDGLRFTSRVLSVNLEHAERVFPFAATCGTELQEWTDAIADERQKPWASLVKEIALRAILGKLEKHLKETYHPGNTSVMNPGSLKEWPLEEQRPLFGLLGDAEKQLGIHLRETGLMWPAHSVSGIRFPSRETFENCMLCPLENCPIRRSPYDKHLYDGKYRL